MNLEPYYQTNLGKLYLGDAKDILPQLEEDSIDLVITDPPYIKEYIHTYSYLADLCPILMKRGASLLTIAAHHAIPEVCKYFDGKLKYRWAICMNQSNGSHSRMMMGIHVMWKPMLWYVKKVFAIKKYKGFIYDMIDIKKKDGQEKAYHKWQQSQDWCYYYINRLSLENEIILDPFMGSGTVAIVCEKLNRNWIGIEISKEYCDIIIRRLENELSS